MYHSYGRQIQSLLENGEYHKFGLQFKIFTNGSPDLYMGKKYLIVYGYGEYGKRDRQPTDDWKKSVKQIIEYESKIGNQIEFEPGTNRYTEKPAQQRIEFD